MTDQHDASVFIGRFQPFHLGHLSVLQECDTDTVFIGVGSSQYHHTLENPFTFEERKHMIQLALSHHLHIKYDIYAIPDIHNPPRWVDHVRHIVPDFSQVLTNNEFTAQLFEKKGYSIHFSGLVQRDLYQGKEIRNRMMQQQSWEQLVPQEVATYLHDINAVERLQQLHQQKQKK
jgi:nicotinamide-nucleotide adenylyltransferase